MRETVGRCLHEAFKMTSEQEDIKKLQNTFCELLEEENKTVAAALAEHIDIIIIKYANQYTVSQVKDEPDASPSEKEFGFNHSNTLGGKISQLDFTSAAKSNKPTGGLKKQATFQNVIGKEEDSETSRGLSKYIILSEYKRELVYQELLPKLEHFNQNISTMMSLWREHAAFLTNFSECLHLFHVPEIHDALVPTLMKHIEGGNNALRIASCKCIVKILIH